MNILTLKICRLVTVLNFDLAKFSSDAGYSEGASSGSSYSSSEGDDGGEAETHSEGDDEESDWSATIPKRSCFLKPNSDLLHFRLSNENKTSQTNRENTTFVIQNAKTDSVECICPFFTRCTLFTLTCINNVCYAFIYCSLFNYCYTCDCRN